MGHGGGEPLDERTLNRLASSRSKITVAHYREFHGLEPADRRLVVARMAQAAERRDVTPLVGMLGKIGTAIVALTAAGELIANRLDDLGDGVFWPALGAGLAVSLALAVVAQVAMRNAKAQAYRAAFFAKELQEESTRNVPLTAQAEKVEASSGVRKRLGEWLLSSHLRELVKAKEIAERELNAARSSVDELESRVRELESQSAPSSGTTRGAAGRGLPDNQVP